MHKAMRIAALALIVLSVLLMAGCGPNHIQLLQEMSAIIAGVTAIATSLGSVLLPGESQKITNAATTVANGIKTLEKVVSDYHSNPSDTTLAKVTAAFADVQSNLDALEQAANVKDDKTRKKLLAIDTAAYQTLALLESSINGKHQSTVAAAQAQGS
jgi:hypothetical protein